MYFFIISLIVCYIIIYIIFSSVLNFDIWNNALFYLNYGFLSCDMVVGNVVRIYFVSAFEYLHLCYLHICCSEMMFCVNRFSLWRDAPLFFLLFSEFLLDLTVAWYITEGCRQLLFSGHSYFVLQLRVGELDFRNVLVIFLFCLWFLVIWCKSRNMHKLNPKADN